MGVVRDVAAVLGIILSTASVVSLFSKTARQFLLGVFRKYGKSDELSKSVAEIKEMLEAHIREGKEFEDRIATISEVNLEFTKAQCRNIIKTIFYKYNDAKVLPLYEKKALMNIESLYIDRLDGNCYARLLLEEMATWGIDYSEQLFEETV